MKKPVLLLALLLFAFYSQSCSSTKKTVEEPQNIILDIQTENIPEQKAFITDMDNEHYQIKKISDNHFADTLKLPEGYYKINIGNEYSNIYLKPGMNLKIYVDGNQFDETIRYEGTGAEINNLMAAQMLDNENFKEQHKPKQLAMLSEEEFLKLVDSVYQAKLKKLEQLPLQDSKFKEMEAKKYLIEKNSATSMYPLYRQYFSGKEYKPGENYPEALEGLDIKDPQLIKIPGYLDLVQNSLYKDIPAEKMKEDYMLALVLTAEEKLTDNPQLKEIIMARLAKSGLNRTKNIDEYYKIIDRNVSDAKLKSELEKTYKTLKKVQAGNPSPDFTAYDINGKEYHLSDFKGKNLYIDLWATWCGPCLMEGPYLEKLKKDYEGKNIEIVSIDVFDDKARWEKMVKSGKLSGVQLIIPDRDADFLLLYNVTSIPRFIFIDKNGNIIDNNAPRPSSPQIRNLIDKYLAE